MKPKTLLITSWLLLLGIIALFFGVQYYQSRQSFQGSLIEPSPQAVDFELTRVGGGTFRMSSQKGRVVLIFFGYANCPDFCPTTMAEYKKIHTELGKQAEMVDFVFVTIDPERDSPEQIESYVAAFHPSFIGLSGTVDELQPVWEGYWVFRQKQEVESEAGYLMAHTTRIYVVDKLGNLRLTFPFGLTANSMANDVERLLAE
jgi:protein SCO1/2